MRRPLEMPQKNPFHDCIGVEVRRPMKRASTEPPWAKNATSTTAGLKQHRETRLSPTPRAPPTVDVKYPLMPHIAEVSFSQYKTHN